MPKAYSSFAARHGWLLIIASGIISLGASLIIARDAFAELLPAGAVPALLVVLIGIAAAGTFVIASLRSRFGCRTRHSTKCRKVCACSIVGAADAV